MNKKWLAFIATIVFVIALAACGGGSAGDTADDGNGAGETENGTAENGEGTFDADEAEALYQQNCASCHGGNLEGQNGPALEQVGADYSEEEILDIILNGKGSGMPGGLIEGEEAENVAAWLADHQ